MPVPSDRHPIGYVILGGVMNEHMGTAIRDIDAKWIIRGIITDAVCVAVHVPLGPGGTAMLGGSEVNGTLHALWRIRDRIVSVRHNPDNHSALFRVCVDRHSLISWDGVATRYDVAVNSVLRWLMATDAPARDVWESCLTTEY